MLVHPDIPSPPPVRPKPLGSSRWFAILGAIAFFVLGSAPPVSASRFVYEPVSDDADGELVGGTTWDAHLTDPTEDALLLGVGRDAGTLHEACLAFAIPSVTRTSPLEEVRLRLNMQGGMITSGLTISVSAAYDLDPLASSGAARFALPRTTTYVDWTVSTTWDESGQRIAKWAESPDLSGLLDEVRSQTGWDAGGRVVMLFLEVQSAGGDDFIRFDDTHPAWPDGGNPGIRPARLRVLETYRDALHGREILCRPEPTSVQVNLVPHRDTEVVVEWGPDSLSLGSATTPVVFDGGVGGNVTLAPLTPDTRYFYRVGTRRAEGGSWVYGPVHAFRSLVPPGSEARICLTSDIHVTNSAALGLDQHLALLSVSLAMIVDYQGADGYHLWLDLGDLVVVRAQRPCFDEVEVDQRYREAREYIDEAAHSIPFVLVRGNHEEVNGWDDDGSPANTTVWSGQALLKWFPPPLPSAFVSGNSTAHPEIGVPGNYFAFDVGDMRVRALDPYLYSMTRPHNGHGETDGSLNNWDWTIGDAQYAWLANDLATREAPFSMITLHHKTTTYEGAGQYYGRGGIEVASYSIAGRPTFEWGGQDSTGQNVIATMRPGFTEGPIHDMLLRYENQVVTKGHDHFWARQVLDGMTYLTLPKPNDAGQHTGNLWGWRWSCFYPDEVTLFESNSGFLDVTVTPSQATFAYVQTYPYGGAGTVLDSFTILPRSGVTGAGAQAGPGLAGRLNAIRSVYPNPAVSSTRLEYEIAREQPVRISIYDATGRRIRDLADGPHEAGVHQVRWDGRDRNDRRVASGVYFARMIASDGSVDSVKLVRIR